MGCSGCRIDKESTSLPSPVLMQKLISLFDELKSRGIALNEIELGPSDILSARNMEAIFQRPDVIEFIDLFSLMTINASFIYPNMTRYVDLAYQLTRYETSKKCGIVIPVEMTQMFNDKYISRIKQNLSVFRDAFPHDLYSVTFNIIFDERFINNPLNKFSYEDLFFRTNSFVEDTELHESRVRIDYVFHHGREDITNPFIAQAFMDSMNELYRHYHADHKRRNGPMIDGVPAFLNFDFENDEIVYHNEELYVRPVVNDRLNIFHESLKYRGEWNADGIISHLAERFNDNLTMASEMKDCSDCSRIVECSKRYTQDLMKILNVQDCFTMLKQYESK